MESLSLLPTVIVFNLVLISFSIFRWVVYIFRLEQVTEVKIRRVFWEGNSLESQSVRELGFRWTKAIRLWSFSRVLGSSVVLLGKDIYTNRLSLYGNTLFDMWLWHQMKYGWKGRVSEHRTPHVPQSVQLMLTSLSVAFTLHDFYYTFYAANTETMR
jgi:hypothetical protein